MVENRILYHLVDKKHYLPYEIKQPSKPWITIVSIQDWVLKKKCHWGAVHFYYYLLLFDLKELTALSYM